MCTQIVLKIKLVVVGCALTLSAIAQPVHTVGYLALDNGQVGTVKTQVTGTHTPHTDNHLNEQELPIWSSWITFADGSEFRWDGNQLVVACKGKTLLLIQPDPVGYSYVLKVYQSSGKTVEKISEREISHFLVEARLLDENGPIVITDEIEGYGTKIEFYDLGLQPLGNVGPSPNGYYYSITEKLNSTLWIAVNPSAPSDEPTLTTADLQLSEIKPFRPISEAGWTCRKIYAVNDNAALVMIRNNGQQLESKILLVSPQLEVLREKDYWFAYFDKEVGFVQAGKDIFYAGTDRSAITKLDANLESDWQIDAKQLSPEWFVGKKKSSAFFKVMEATADGGLVCLTAAPNQETGLLQVISPEGKLISQLQIDSACHNVQITALSKRQLTLMCNSKLISHEW